MSAKQFFSRVGAWFAAFFTVHNMKAIGSTVVEAGKVAEDVTTGQYAKLPADVINTAAAAKAVHVNGFESGAKGSTPATSSSVPTLSVVSSNDSDATGHK